MRMNKINFWDDYFLWTINAILLLFLFLFSFFPHLARALSRFFVFNIQIVRKQYVICNVISYKFKCTTVKIAFTTEDDIRMSKHVLQTKSCGLFIKNFYMILNKHPREE